ncbi:MAG: hypothetical protein WBZ48_08845 [Bacteroidota bacterium]
MKEMLSVVPIALFFLVGVISSVMAFKSLSSKKFLPFHEKAASKSWSELEDPFKFVVLSLLRLGGLGFLVISILLIVCPILNYYFPNIFYEYLIPLIALIYCTGLFLINFSLSKSAKANTPWKESIYAMVILLVGIFISILN